MGSHGPEITYNVHVLICSTVTSKTVEYGATKKPQTLGSMFEIYYRYF